MKQQEIFQELLHGRKLYVYGGGYILRKHWDYLDRTYHIHGVIDKKLDSVHGHKAIRPENFFGTYDKERSVVLITCVYVPEISRMLRDAGFQHVETIFSLVKDPYFKFHPPVSTEGKSRLQQIMGWLADEKSRNVLSSIMQHRDRQEYDYRAIYEGEQYFPQGVWGDFSEEEIVIDAGAFDGDSVQSFLKHIPSIKKIYAFEPDQENFIKLSQSAQRDARIRCEPYAVWDTDTELSFVDGEGASSRIEDGMKSASIKARALDHIVADDPVTFIKMDVEGAELHALRGAKRIITEYHPKLAISVYHKEDDLWKIPCYIKELAQGYQLYLRHHGTNWLETVLYALYGKEGENWE